MSLLELLYTVTRNNLGVSGTGDVLCTVVIFTFRIIISIFSPHQHSQLGENHEGTSSHSPPRSPSHGKSSSYQRGEIFVRDLDYNFSLHQNGDKDCSSTGFITGRSVDKSQYEGRGGCCRTWSKTKICCVSCSGCFAVILIGGT